MTQPALFRALAVLLWSAAFAASGQFSADAPAGIGTTLTKLFGKTAFTAKADLQVLDNTQKEWLRTPMSFAALDGKFRVDLDLSQVKSRELPDTAVAAFKQAGLDRVVSVVRPVEKQMFIIYPGARSYARVPANREDTGATNRPPEKTLLSRETAEGHPCVKNRVLLRDDRGGVILDALTWNATDLNDFPVRIQTKENGSTTILRLQQIKLNRPDTRQFEPPAGFTAYDSLQDLLLAASKKLNAATSTKK